MTVYRSNNPHQQRDEAEANAAHELLATHVPDQETGLCRVCFAPGPCRPANATANRLIELGRPVLAPEKPKGPRNVWRGWLGPQRRPMPHTAPLLSFAWRLRFGLATTAERPAGGRQRLAPLILG